MTDTPTYIPDENQGFAKVDKAINKIVEVWKGDITTLAVDAIVNAANKRLLPGGGVCGAIHSRAGPELYEECRKIGGCYTGDAVITKGYNLPAKHVIHTVGPTDNNGEALKSCYRRCLDVLVENNLKSIAFNCISTGIYGFPNDLACNIALKTVREWLDTNNNKEKVDKIIFCVFLPVDNKLYLDNLRTFFPEK
ncbi:A1pp-domain-containing protein [Neocallimastix lanati (nom. inval.)]|jgi:O-acetyl-ADP-ribose deacetylase (regulator of RNase III)|uniref:A1pp-domain-containing protein n=1 Tax=Neocallimastix californiae TaxID=1754190 RepID=A0A1Y2E8Q3_9FUNG|nr:A1pp-domain-containing protein [Neocallimastix sp. JGI-2020a]ORY67922.1 A1pp-domain-containing protein [Neocallimastix californiae]|eukprot:ORY67922.1 A1pp-domain-containing protein [Neocallimastix californiae]